jgi:molecular chaperone DnaJ
MAAKDYYNILGVSRTANDKEIKSAYRKLARQHHPDVNPGNKGAEERFKEINQAFEILSDTEKRKKYDQYGQNWQYGEQMAEAARQQQSAQGNFRYNQEPGQGFRFEEEDLESVFGDLLGGRTSPFGRRTTRTHRGQDIESEIEVSLEEAFNGTIRNISLRSEGPCSTCKGTGRIQNLPCSICRGAGVVSQLKRLEVKIPPGVDNGSRVRIAGKGEPGAGGGSAGDLYLVISVQPNETFKREGTDLHVEITLPLTTAILGGEVKVPTLKGTKLALKIPSETQNERIFKLTGQGMPHLGGTSRGALLVKVKVVLPETLNAEEKALFEKFRELRPE